MKPKLKGLLFDMDGVLIDGMPYHWMAWRDAMKSLGVDIDRMEIYRREGEQGRVTARDLLAQGGLTPTEAQIDRVLAEKEKRFARIYRPGKTIPHAKALVKFTHGHPAGLVHAIVTGTSMGEWQKVFPDYWRDVFTHVVTGDQVRQGKPHPEPYLTALVRTKLSPQEVVVVENAPYGIRSAKAAGLRVMAVCTSLGPEHLHEADAVFENLKALQAALAKELG